MMFVAGIFALLAYSICKNEVECSIARYHINNGDAQSSMESVKSYILLKKIESIATQKSPKALQRIEKDKKTISKSNNGSNISVLPLKGSDQVRFDRRQPKFLSSLAFLAGIGAGSLATAASQSPVALAQLLQNPNPFQLEFPGYFPGFYEPQRYPPYSYPIFYPFPNNFNNFANVVQTTTPPSPSTTQEPLPGPTLNSTAGGNDFHERDDTSRGNDEDDEEPVDPDGLETGGAATTQEEVKTTVERENSRKGIEHPAITEEPKLRQHFNGNVHQGPPRKNRITTIVPIIPNYPVTETELYLETEAPVTTRNPITMNPTIASNVTVSTSTSTTTNTEPPQFQGYYGGNPQDVGQVVLTTPRTDPQQRYLPVYTRPTFPLPFKRPAAFNTYQNVQPPSSPFVNSFSSGEQFPEFLNTIDSNGFQYDSQNTPNYNGFRPIFK